MLVLIGSSEVREAFRDWRNQLGPYWLQIWNAAQARRRADDLIDPDTDRAREGWQKAQGEAEMERIMLSGPISELEKAATALRTRCVPN